MTSASTDWDEDLPADLEEEYQTFIRTLERTECFRLLFIRSTPAEGEQLIARVKEELPQKTIEVLRLDKPIENLYQIVERLPNREQVNILFIQGLEHSLSEYGDRYSYGWNGVPRILNHLNQQRERFRDNFNICFIFILRLFALQYFIHRAPDFFDWRSGVFELSKKYQGLLENKILCQDLDGAIDQKAELLIKQGDTLMEGNAHEEAFDRYKQALKLTFTNYTIWNNRGERLYELHNYEAAIECYDKALEIKLDFYEAWYNRGIALEKLGRLEEAITSYDQALKFKRDYHEAWYNRGIALEKLGRLEEAITSYDQALKFKRDYREAWSNRGYALKNLGRVEEAIASYDQALKFKPDDTSAFYNKACCYALQGNVEQAIENLKQAIHLNPDKYREMAKTDLDFDSIRDDERFHIMSG